MKKLFLQIILISFIYSQKLTFQTTLFSHLYNDPNKNICISPLSIYQIISLTSNGANGKTQKEILEVLTKKNDQKTQINLNINNENILKNYDKNCIFVYYLQYHYL